MGACAVGDGGAGVGVRMCPRAERESVERLYEIATAGAGVVDRSFPTVNGTVSALEPDNSGGWFVGGGFSCVGDRAAARLVRLTGDGAVDNEWKPDLPEQADVTDLSRRGDTLYVAGSFGVAALAVKTGAARWIVRSNGPLGVTAIAVDSRRVYIGGDFSRIGGRRKHQLAAIDRGNGIVLDWLAPAIVGDVLALAIERGGLYVGGNIRVGRDHVYLARVSAQSGRVADWKPATNRRLRPGSGVSVVEEMIVARGLVITTGPDGWQVTDARTGRVRSWMYAVQGAPDVFAVAGDTLFLGGRCRGGLHGFTGSRRYNLAAVLLPSGRPTPWAPLVGPRWPRDSLPRVCIDAIAAKQDAVLIAAFPGP